MVRRLVPVMLVSIGAFAAALPEAEGDLTWGGRKAHPAVVNPVTGNEAGSVISLRDMKDFDLACAGIPVTVAESGVKVWYLTAKSRAEMTDADKKTLAAGSVVEVGDVERYPLASRRTKLLDDLDAATKGAFPVRVDACRPLRILPRVRLDGTLDSVTILNLSIGDTDELKVRVRRAASSRAIWQDAKLAAPRQPACAAGASPSEQIVTIPNLAGSGGI